MNKTTTKESLTRNEKLKLLRQWQAAHDAAEAAWEDAKKVFGRDMTGSPLFEAQWKMFDTLTRAVALALGDDVGWLNWFAYENKMGKKGHPAGLVGKKKQVRTLRQLLRLLDVCR